MCTRLDNQVDLEQLNGDEGDGLILGGESPGAGAAAGMTQEVRLTLDT